MTRAPGSASRRWVSRTGSGRRKKTAREEKTRMSSKLEWEKLQPAFVRIQNLEQQLRRLSDEREKTRAELTAGPQASIDRLRNRVQSLMDSLNTVRVQLVSIFAVIAVASLVVAVLSTQAWMILLLTIWVLKVKWV